MEKLFVIKTEKGYLKGDLYHAVEFVEKANARTFNETGILLYWESITSDLIDFFGIKYLAKESV